MEELSERLAKYKSVLQNIFDAQRDIANTRESSIPGREKVWQSRKRLPVKSKKAAVKTEKAAGKVRKAAGKGGRRAQSVVQNMEPSVLKR